jgi:hypothetical protein
MLKQRLRKAMALAKPPIKSAAEFAPGRFTRQHGGALIWADGVRRRSKRVAKSEPRSVSMGIGFIRGGETGRPRRREGSLGRPRIVG